MSKSKADLNWNTVTISLPPTPHKVGDHSQISDTLLLIHNGAAVPGVMVKYTRDFNFQHKIIKAGDTIFTDMHDHLLEGVTAWYRTKDLSIKIPAEAKS